MRAVPDRPSTAGRPQKRPSSRPYVPYAIVSDGRHVSDIPVELETVKLNQHPAVLDTYSADQAPAFATQVRRAHGAMLATTDPPSA